MEKAGFSHVTIQQVSL